jgi:1,4-dihydroxy-2-naphthoyl-CoA hydrolase
MSDPGMLERLKEMGDGALATKMGIQIVEVSAERVVATMPVAGNTQPFGLLHGGASVVLAEQAGSIAANLVAGADRFAVGIEISASHLKAVREGVVTAVATPVSVGRTLVTYQIEITNEVGERTCVARLTCALRDRTTA